MLVADLAICSLAFLCINHELYFVPLYAMVLLIRVWLSFSLYRRSRMAAFPLVLIAGLTLMIWADTYTCSYDFFLMPWITSMRTVLSLFGMERCDVDSFFRSLFDSGWQREQIIHAAAFVGTLWLLVLPLGIYVRQFVTKRLRPGRLTLWKNIGLCFYLFGILFLMAIVEPRNTSIAVFLLALFLIPFVFNGGNVRGLLSRGEVTFVAVLALLAVGYVCGLGMETKALITAGLLPAVFYALVNWYLRRGIAYREIVPVVVGSVCFALAQYTTGAMRLSMLQLSAVLVALPVVLFARKTRKYLLSAVLFAMMLFVIPVLCIGYNPYTVPEARRLYVCDDYTDSPNGLLYVWGKRGMGIRDRFGIVLPAEYGRVKILRHWSPFFKVGDDGSWQIYDIDRHKLLSEEHFRDVVPCNDTTFVLKSEAGDRYLLLRSGTIADEAPTEDNSEELYATIDCCEVLTEE